MDRRHFLLATAAALSASTLARAQTKTARIVIGFAAGGPGDLLARVVADQMKPRWAPSVIVDNRPGGAGRIAIDAVRSADPDGLTLINTPASILTILPHAYKAQPFDPFKDLVPVAGLTELDFAVVSGPMAPAKTLAEYIALARGDAKLATYGTAGVGTPQHLIGFKLQQASGVTLTHAPYRGGGPALQDTIGGQLPATIGAISGPMIAAHNAGTVRILATTGAKRSPFLPDVPTIEEAGFKGVVAADWSGLLAPAGTPAAVIDEISRIALDVVNTASYREAVGKLNMVPLPLGPAACAARLRAEYNYWGPAVQATGFTQDG